MAHVGPHDPFGSPAELPLSQASSLPSDLPLDLSHGEENTGGGVAPDALLVGLGAVPTEAVRARMSGEGSAVGAPSPRGVGASGAASSSLTVVPMDVGVRGSIFGRRGRRNIALENAMARAIAECGEARDAVEGSVGRGPPHSDTMVVVALAGQQDEQDGVYKQLCRRARLDGGGLALAAKRPRSIDTSAFVVAQALQTSAQLGAREGERLDPETSRACEFLLGGQELAIASKKVRSDALEIHPTKLDVTTKRLVAALNELERAQRDALERSAAKVFRHDGLVFYLDFCSYDETPLVVAMQGGDTRDQNAAAEKTGKSDRPGSQVPAIIFDLGQGSELAAPLFHRQGAQTILQIVQKGVMVLRGAEGFVTIVNSTLRPLAALHRTTAPC